MTLEIVILAAGKGKRMLSESPKVLMSIGGKPLLQHVVNVARALKPANIHVVHGHEGGQVQHVISENHINWVEQKEQLGTAHAVQQTLSSVNPKSRLLILYGDVPLITQATLTTFLKTTPEDALGFISTNFEDPTGFGRVIRNDDNQVTSIVEHIDATEAQKQIQEINTGVYAVPAKYLEKWLTEIKNSNTQKEYYITDIITKAIKEKVPVEAYEVSNEKEFQGINDRMQWIQVERLYQQRTAEKFIREGVIIKDPMRFDLRGDATIAKDVVIDINVVLEGNVTIGKGTLIEPNCILKNVSIGKDVHVKANSIIEDATVGNACNIGPFARVRPETTIGNQVNVGNFVEVKKSHLQEGAKVNHLTYIGDSQIGKAVNVGAGTITCNYDGTNKHKTIIEDNAFIGSNTALVAPVTIGKGAVIGAGSVITRDAPADKLTLTRAEQTTVDDWKKN